MFSLNMFLFIILSVVLSLCHGQGPRISGGDPIQVQKYPFSTALLTNSGQGAYHFRCGGTILTNTRILSAASCFHTGNTVNPVTWWRARVGSSSSGGGGTIHIVNLINIHPEFNIATYEHDIAVLRTSLPINEVPGLVQRARVAGGAYTFNNNAAVTAIGWGAVSGTDYSASSQLQETQIFIVDQQTCTNRYNEVNFVVRDNMVCAGWLDVGVRAQCQGDSGSPLLDNGTVVAVFSRSQECGETGRYPGINTRLAPYLNWITSVVY